MVLNQDLKQRLIGAAVLIGVGVLVIPSVLKWPPELASDSMHESERGQYSGVIRDSLVKSADSLRRQEEATLVSAVIPERNNSSSASFVESNAKSILSPSLSSQTAGSVSGWVVQIGSFVHQENALKMRNGAISSGYKAFIKAVKKGTQTIYKVRIGPKRNISRAKALKRELDRQLPINAFLISLPSD